MLLQGFMLVPSEFPNWLRWSYKIGFHTYSWRTFMYKEFHGQDYPDAGESIVYLALCFISLLPKPHQYNCFSILINAGLTGQDILETYEIENVDPVNDMMVLIGYAALIHLFSFIFLWGKHVWNKKSNTNNTAILKNGCQ